MARLRKEGRGSNLFAIDHAMIVAALQDANAPLLRRRDRLIESLGRVPDRLETGEQVENAAILARQLLDGAEETRSARLADGQPFRAADKVVKVCAAIDLEALRLFVTHAAILAACRKHLDENGPDSLDGAQYRQVAAFR